LNFHQDIEYEKKTGPKGRGNNCSIQGPEDPCSLQPEDLASPQAENACDWPVARMSFFQGLKPSVFGDGFAARLKSSPFKT